jgi:DNA-binding NarL/FixJ family response regulator
VQITECTARYGASQLANGTGPAEARQTALFVAGELEAVAACLRRLVRLDPAERRVLARRLNGLGLTRRQIAARLGITERAVREYLRPVSPDR